MESMPTVTNYSLHNNYNYNETNSEQQRAQKRITSELILPTI